MTAPEVPVDLQVWDAAACGAYLHQTKEYFLRETRHVAGFPAVLRMSAANRPRWSAKAVIAWALRS